MSSMIRRFQIRALKKMGFSRQTNTVVMTNGTPTLVKLKKGTGKIIATNSRHYPGLGR